MKKTLFAMFSLISLNSFSAEVCVISTYSLEMNSEIYISCSDVNNSKPIRRTVSLSSILKERFSDGFKIKSHQVGGGYQGQGQNVIILEKE